MCSLTVKVKFSSALGWFFPPFKRWKNVKEFLRIARGYGMKHGIRQWFKSRSCCFNWIILLFWSGVWFAMLRLSVKLSCAIFALCQIYSRCCASGNQTSTDLNSISVFCSHMILIFCIWEMQWSRPHRMDLCSVGFILSDNKAFLFSQHTD